MLTNEPYCKVLPLHFIHLQISDNSISISALTIIHANVFFQGKMLGDALSF